MVMVGPTNGVVIKVVPTDEGFGPASDEAVVVSNAGTVVVART